MEKAEMPLFGSAKLELTRACNHRCCYCYNDVRDGGNKCAEENCFLSPEEKRRNISTILEKLIELHIQKVNITGGEPAMDKSLLFHTLEDTKRLKIQCSLNTNLSLFTADEISRLCDSGLDSILISFPSHDPKTYDAMTRNKTSFKKVIENLNSVQTAMIPNIINMVVSNLNKNQVYETGGYLATNFGIKRFAATPIVPVIENQLSESLTREEIIKVFDNLLRLKDKHGIKVSTLRPIPWCIFEEPKRYSDFLKGCAAGRSEAYIGIDGNVSTCSSIPHVSGNLFKEDLSQILIRIAGEYDDKRIIPDECLPCPEASRCRAGCNAESQLVNKEKRSKQPYFFAPLKDKVFSPKKIKINFLGSGRIIFDGDSEILEGSSSQEYLFSAFGNRTPINETERAILGTLYQRHFLTGIPLTQIVKDYSLDAHRLDRFLNRLASKEIIRYQESK